MRLLLITILPIAAFCQTPETSTESESSSRFEVADVHVSAPARLPAMAGPYTGGGRYALRNATMLDLIRTAWGFTADKIVGGPNWLEMTRFDVVAVPPAGAAPDTMKVMLRNLLEERFRVTVHGDTRPLPAWALTPGKKPLLKEADGSGETGCKTQETSGRPQEGGLRLLMMGTDGKATAISLGPGMTIQFSCRNMTMQAFASGLRGMIGASLGPNPVTDETGLKGIWNFDLKWSMQINGGPLGDRITVFTAVEKQLGLKLEPREVPMPVLVVDSANEKPTPNAPDVTSRLPALPTEFEVAEIKPSSPDAKGTQLQIQPGGRLNARNMTLKNLIERAWGITSDDLLAGAPKFLETDRYDIVAKAPSAQLVTDEAPALAGLLAARTVDPDQINLMLRALLTERFKMVVHNEDRPVNAFTLTAVKPKLKKADPSNRTGFHEGPGADGKDPRVTNPAASRLVACQNMTMAQFAESLPRIASGYIGSSGVLDATGLEGAWDFTLNFSGVGATAAKPMVAGAGRGGASQTAELTPEAADPSGAISLGVISLNEALDKQLGLKLETTKRPAPVLVIDHVEPKPIEN